jgi:hypothetical protein
VIVNLRGETFGKPYPPLVVTFSPPRWRVVQPVLHNSSLRCQPAAFTSLARGLPLTEDADMIVCDASPAAVMASITAVLIDFCHMLLNANEFIYID